MHHKSHGQGKGSASRGFASRWVLHPGESASREGSASRVGLHPEGVGDTVNKQVVRILLECILVDTAFCIDS